MRQRCTLSSCRSVLSRTYATQIEKFGQPTFNTHPHLLLPNELTPGIPKAEYDRRRKNLLVGLPEKAVVVSCGARLQYMSESIFYKFRQASDFAYLTGFSEPDAAVVLEKNSSSKGYSMRFFCTPKDADRERWEGPRTGLDGAMSEFGADYASDISTFPYYLENYLQSNPSNPVYLDLPDTAYSARTSKTSNSSSLLNMFVESPLSFLGIGKRKSDVDGLMKILTQRRGRSVHPLKVLLERLRVIKSSNELALMRRAASLSSEAHAQCMKFARPGLNESAIASHFEYHTTQGGASRLAYVPVVASGPSSLTIHYTSNDQLLQQGHLLLLDAGCEFAGYASDITRTFPVKGTFTPAQKDLYSVVLQANKDVIKLCTENQAYTMNDLHRHSCRSLLSGLKQLGFHIDMTALEQDLFPHFISHPLGMDLHDTSSFSRSAALKTGMVLTIEPGLYIPHSDKWPKAFRGLGIRIEDEVAVGKDDYEVLSANAPKEIVDVEAATLNLLD